MEPLISFFIQHWILSTIFVVLLLALIVNELIFRSSSGSNSLSTEEAIQWINHKEAVLIDTRNSQAFLEGHILGSLNIPADVFSKKAGVLEKFKDRNLIIVCALGQSSQKIVSELKNKGFKAVLLSGGLAAWRSAGLPLSKN